MVSQKNGNFIHLLAATAGSDHEPQVFRMRLDQPLRKLLRAYLSFRQLPIEAEKLFRMAVPDRNLGHLDPAATAGTCGLADGDRVLFVGGPPAVAEGYKLQGTANAAAKEPSDAPVEVPGAVPAEAPPAQAEAPAQAEEPAQVDAPAQAEAPAEAPVSAEAEEASAQAPMEAPSAAMAATAADGLPGKALAGDDAGAPANAAEGAPDAPMEDPSTGEVARPAGKSKGRGGRGGRGRRRAGPASGETDTATATGNHQRDDNTWVELTPREFPLSTGRAQRGRGRGRGRGRKGSKATPAPAVASTQADAKQSGSTRRGRARRLKDPEVPKRNMRCMNVTSGPAKGWHVMAWLKDITSHKHRTHDHTVQWRIRSPSRKHHYTAFSSGTKTNLQDEVSEGVYTQIYTAVRPELMKRIKDRRAVLEGVRFSRKSRVRCARAPQQTKRSRREPITPVRTQETALLATQCFVAVPDCEEAKTWACECTAHLRRHPRCIFAGHVQPPLVHLRDRMRIGRGETNDVVLESKLTPQMISRCHAELLCEDGVFQLIDSGSTNGMQVNGQSVRKRQSLVSGDIITFGVQTLHPEFDYIFEVRPGHEPAPRNEEPEPWMVVQPDPAKPEAAAEADVDRPKAQGTTDGAEAAGPMDEGTQEQERQEELDGAAWSAGEPGGPDSQELDTMP